MTIEQQPNAPAPERVERHVNADSCASRDVRYCPLGLPVTAGPVRFAFCSECKRVRKSIKGCWLMDVTPQTPTRVDEPGHRPQDPPSGSRADGSAPGLATTGAPFELGAYRRLRAVVGFTDEQAQVLARAGHDVVAVYSVDQLIAGVR